MNLKAEIEKSGFAFVRNALGTDELEVLSKLFQATADHSGIRRRGGSAYAARNVLWEHPGIAATFVNLGLCQIATEALGMEAFPINATCFDKNADANWKVPGHQDLMMPVECQTTEPGFGGWSRKLGVDYVEPPTDVLAKLIALRVHLDDCPASNGALAVAPGTHQRGKLRDADITAISSGRFAVCAAAAGDVLLMKPLLVHRSSAATTPSRRRVLHVVFATDEPGTAVRWKHAAASAEYETKESWTEK